MSQCWGKHHHRWLIFWFILSGLWVNITRLMLVTGHGGQFGSTDPLVHGAVSKLRCSMLLQLGGGADSSESAARCLEPAGTGLLMDTGALVMFLFYHGNILGNQIFGNVFG